MIVLAENKKEATGAEAPTPAPVFTKEQILTSSKYAKHRDALSVILSEGKHYDLGDVDKQLEIFLKGKVK
jgi:hypothetical protein